MTSTKSVPQEYMDLERIVIYPRDLDRKTRHQLYLALKRLGVHFEAGFWD